MVTIVVVRWDLVADILFHHLVAQLVRRMGSVLE